MFAFDGVTELLRGALGHRILSSAIQHLDHAPDFLQRDVKARIRGAIHISGFRDPLRAPRPRLIRELSSVFGRRMMPTLDLVMVWADAQPDLVSAIRDYLAEHFGTDVEGSLGGVPVEQLKAEDLLRLADGFLEAHPGADRSDVAVIIGTLGVIGHSTPPESEMEDESSEPESETTRQDLLADSIPLPTPSSARFSSWLSDLAALPVEALEWDEIPQLIAQLEQLARRHSADQEREGTQLSAEIETLRQDYQDILRYLRLDDVSYWDAKKAQATERPALRAELAALVANLQEFADIRTQSPMSFAEDERKIESLRTRAAGIREVYSRLNLQLGQAVVSSTTTTTELAEPLAEEAKGVDLGRAAEAIGDSALAEHESPLPELKEQTREDSAPPSGPGSESATEGGGSHLRREERADSDEGAARAATAEPGGQRDIRGVGAATVGPVRAETEVPPLSWDDVQFSLLADDDLAGAYWIGRSLEARQLRSPIAPGVLATLQGSRWLSHENGNLAAELVGLVGQHQPMGNVEDLLALAAAIPGALIAPASGLGAWLQGQVPIPAIQELVSALRTFALSGKALPTELLLGVAGAARQGEALRDLADSVQDWLARATQRRSKLARATNIWVHLVREDLAAAFQPIVQDRRRAVTEVRASIERWQEARFVAERIDETDRRLVGSSKSPIVGPPREQIQRWVAEVCELGIRWCRLVEAGTGPLGDRDWQLKQAMGLRASIADLLPEAEAALMEIGEDSDRAGERSGARCLLRSLWRLRDVLSLDSSVPKPVWREFDGELLRRLAEGPTLVGGLRARLLWLPEVSVNTDLEPDSAELVKLADRLREGLEGGRTLVQAYRGWVGREDFRFLERIASVLLEASEAGRLRAEAAEHLAEARARLREGIRRVVASVEQAVVDGLIEDERVEYAAAVAIDVENVLEFGPQFERLSGIQDDISKAREQRVVQQRQRWITLDRDLSVGHQEDWSEIRAFVEGVLERKDTRLIDEIFAQLEQVLAGNAELPKHWTVELKRRDVLREFLEMSPKIAAELQGGVQPVLQAVQGRRRLDVLNPSELSVERVREIEIALKAWIDLKRRNGRHPENPGRLEEVLRYLGFRLTSAIGRVTFSASSDEWAVGRAKVSAGELCPVPEFGSQAGDALDILCVWNRPDRDTLSLKVRELGGQTHPTIVIFFGVLSVTQRQAIAHVSPARALAVLDESLLVFLGREMASRLPAFFRCVLPYTALNPYRPFQAGQVPREMFVGREEMIEELLSPHGSCLVFGGRQLGKTALLRHVLRLIEKPEERRIAALEDIALLGDPAAGQPPETLWVRLRDIFKTHGLVGRRVVSTRPDEIERQIRELFARDQQLHFTLFLDEADKFLDADSREGFPQVFRLRALMVDSEYRFKVVLAGLQDVQRFQGLPNQPLAHLGRGICVGPLEGAAAEHLVREPMEVMGVRFGDATVVLNVLSYTNYHPGLIQLFCHELLRGLRRDATNRYPPYTVTQEDVERVYRSRDVRERIRERFEWTLALDRRYQAIAWSMIADQSRQEGSFARAYGPSEILLLVRSFWPRGFRDTRQDSLRATLDEMCGLGVLIRTLDGTYRLRSPNVVRLMGREGDIETRLLELETQPEPRSLDVDHHRAPLDAGGRRYSALTFAQERMLVKPSYGVALVFGSAALNLGLMVESTRRALQGMPPDESFAELVTTIPSDVQWRGDIRLRLERFADGRDLSRGAVLIQAVTGPIAAVNDRIREAWQFCARRERSRQWLRVVFTFDSAASWAWLGQAVADREELERRVDAVVGLVQWTEEGLRQRLSHGRKLVTEETIRKMLGVTSGWPVLVDALFDRCGSDDDPRVATSQVDTELKSEASELTRQLLQELGLGIAAPTRDVVGFVAGERSVPGDESLAEFVDSASPMSDALYWQTVEYLVRMGTLHRRGGDLVVDEVVARVLSHAG